MNKFLKGAFVLGIAGFLVKVMGMFFRIPLTLWVGAEGISYYSSVYPIYTFILILSTSGFPVAISRMVSERTAVKNYDGAHRVFRLSQVLMGAIGLVSFLLVFFCAGFIEEVVLNNHGSFYSIRAIAPALLLVPIMSSYRGYFQGQQNMNPTAVSQLVEQFFRVVIGLLIARMLMPRGSEYVSAGATFGCTAGAIGGLGIMLLVYLKSKPRMRTLMDGSRGLFPEESASQIVKKMLAIAIPITIGASILPLVNTIDSMMVMRILKNTGWTELEAKMLWGRLGSYCDSLTGMPQVFITAIAMSLVPAISSAFKLKNMEEMRDNIKLALRSAMLIAFPCAAGMFALAHPILSLLYPTAERAQEVADAVPTLQICCVLIVLAAVITTITGALQGIGRQMVPVWNIAIGALFKIAGTALFVSIRSINVNGGPMGSIICYVIAAILDIRATKKYAGVKFDMVATFVKPLASSAIMGLLAAGAYRVLFAITSSNSVSCLGAIAAGVIVYCVLVLRLKAISREELLRLPKGELMVRVLSKVHLI